MARIGIVGYGYIGRYVYEQIKSRPQLGLEIAFVYNRSREKLAELPAGEVLDDLSAFASRRPDLVVELAHPDITRQHGQAILEVVDYMPLSLTALADAGLERCLLETAQKRGTRLYVPHGAVVGLDALQEGRDIWEEVSITMKKAPKSIDFNACGRFKAEDIREETVLYDGPARALCAEFPRNVNSHAATALAGIGFERTRSVLIADPALEVSIIHLRARGQGVELDIERRNPMKGVSGVFTLVSALASIGRAKVRGVGLQIC